MKIEMAKTAGFCFGVARAVDMAYASGEGTYMLGPIIHNGTVIEQLKQRGVECVDDINNIPDGAKVLVRAHGAPEGLYRELEAKGCKIIDATCPNVSRIHRIVRDACAEGRTVVIFGDPSHPEVEGISGWCLKALALRNESDAGELFKKKPELCQNPLCVVAQTTSNRAKWEKFVKYIRKVCTNAKIFDTICYATDERQRECLTLAGRSDVMLVIGDRLSSNTRKLTEIARTHCTKVYRIDGARELDPCCFDGARVVGMTAGASTPAWIIKEVVNRMSEELKNENTEIIEPTAEADKKAEPEITPVTGADEEESFEQLLEKSVKTLYTGEKVTGVVTAISSGEVNVDLGVKQAGYIPATELSDDPTYKAEEHIGIGDEIEAFVMRVNDAEGTVMLSKKRLDSIKGWDSIETARDERTIVEGVVIEDNKGGVVASVNGVHVFIPASQTGLPKSKPMSELVKQKVRLRITEVNRARRRVVGSIRAVIQEERRAKAEKIWNEIAVGNEYEGTVKSLTNYGVFVDIGGVDGMVHISELSWTRVRHPSDVVNVGDKIKVHVISFDPEKKKISLGYRRAEDNPWLKFVTNYSIGDVVPVKVIKFMTFGAFAEVLPGVDGLIHISQIANQRIGKPEDVLSEGEVVNAKIIDVDTEHKKISLSIRAVLEDEAEQNRVTADEPLTQTVYQSDAD